MAEAETIVEEGPPLVEVEEVVPPPPSARPRPPLLWPWLLALLLLVVGGFLAWWLLSRDDGHGKRAVVPNVIGQPQSQAVARVNSKGLVARVVTKPGNAPAGRVFAEEPGAGTQVARRAVVTLSVSAAASLVPAPNVVGQRAPAATAQLRASGLVAALSSVASDKPRGTVLSQSPAAGAKVAKGSTVVIRISRGTATVPGVVGQTRDTAVAAVRAAGLVPQAFTVPSTQPKGTVVAQSPKAGTRMPGGSKVRLNVSNGQAPGGAPPPPPPPPSPPPAGGTKPATVTVPDVTGQPQEAAQRQLNSSGLKAGVVYVPSDEPQGTVVSQSPESGTTQKRGTRIQLNVSLGPSPGEQ
ncbi:MAG: PASTA domain-containing protein, partial [Actinomycetota bacterium]|nr:PASTA domain-containing protein [Actinomycetota bacterium]